MATFRNAVMIARPTNEVFAFLADFGHIPTWNYAIESAAMSSSGSAVAGGEVRPVVR